MSNDEVTTLLSPLQKLVNEAEALVADEVKKKALCKIVAKKRELGDALRVLKNVQAEYELLLADIGAEL